MKFVGSVSKNGTDAAKENIDVSYITGHGEDLAELVELDNSGAPANVSKFWSTDGIRTVVF